MSSSPKQDGLSPICILGGTFDPVHRGHLKIALSIHHILKPQALLLLPCANPPHRTPTLATASQRLTMLKQAIQPYPQLSIDYTEFSAAQAQIPNYTYNTLQTLRKHYPKPRPICLIIGTDAFLSFQHWYCWKKIIELTHLILVTRPNHPLQLSPNMQTWLVAHQCSTHQDLCHNPNGKIWLSKTHAINISSSDIRARIQQKKKYAHLIPYQVEKYIKVNSLYQKLA